MFFEGKTNRNFVKNYVIALVFKQQHLRKNSSCIIYQNILISLKKEHLKFLRVIDTYHLVETTSI